MAPTPKIPSIADKLKGRKAPIPGSGHVKYPPAHDPEPQEPIAKPRQGVGRGGTSLDQAQKGAQPNNDDTSGKNKDEPGYYDQAESGSRNPRAGTDRPGSPSNPVDVPRMKTPKIPAPKIPAPPKKKSVLKTGLARYGTQIR